jgi:Big-like domain-containing protein
LLVAASATGTLIANTWNTVSVSASLQASTNYWFLYNTNGRTTSVNNMRYNPGSAGRGVYSNGTIAFGSWPATFPSATIYHQVFSLFATYGFDVTPPTVTSVTPPDGATGVIAATAVTATFSEAINTATLTTGTFVLRNAANAVVTATISYNATTRVGTLTPSAALAGSTTYTATISGGSPGVKDVAGNALAGNVVWSFTTVGASVTVGLTTIGSSLDTGDSNFLTGSKVTTSAAGQIASMSVYVGNVDSLAANRQYQVAIYTDNAGRPGTRVAVSTTATLVANSWNTVSVSAPLQASTNYWLVYNTNGRTGSVNNMRYNPGSAGRGVYSNATVVFGTWPTTFPAATVYHFVFSLFATFGP